MRKIIRKRNIRLIAKPAIKEAEQNGYLLLSVPVSTPEEVLSMFEEQKVALTKNEIKILENRVLKFSGINPETGLFLFFWIHTEQRKGVIPMRVLWEGCSSVPELLSKIMAKPIDPIC